MSGPVETCDAKADPARRPGHHRRAQPGGPGRRHDGPAGAAPAGSPHGRGLVLRRPHGPRRRRWRAGHRHRPPPPHRPADGHLAGRGRDAAPGQPRRRAAHPTRPAQPHDGGPGRGPRRGGDRRRRPGSRSTASSSGWPSPRPPDTASPPSSTTPSCPGWRSTPARPPSWSASWPASPHRLGPTPTTSGPSWPCGEGTRSCPCGPSTSTRSSCWRGPSTWATTRSSSPGSSPTSAPAGTSSRWP